MRMNEDFGPELDFDSPFRNAVCIFGFDAALTCFHTALFRPPDAVLRILALPPEHIAPAVRLHSDHVLLLRVHSGDSLDLATSLSDWLKQRGFASESPQRVFRANTTTPIEDGFFACLSAANGIQSAPHDLDSVGRLKWEKLSPDSTEIGHILANFIQDDPLCQYG